MQQTLLGMFVEPPRSIRLVHDSTRGLDSKSFWNAVLDVGPTLTIIRSTTNHVFGAVIYDTFRNTGGWIPGHADNFLFTLGNIGGTPVKLIKSFNGQTLDFGVCMFNIYTGLVVGGSDLLTFGGVDGRCIPRTFTTVAPGYTTVPVTDTLLAGSRTWTPDRIEVYAMEF